MSEIVTDLDGMEADEDVLVKKNLSGGTFVGWLTACQTCGDLDDFLTATSSISEPSVTTQDPTNVNNSQRSATLNGTITPSNENMTWYFELSPTNDFTEGNTELTEVTPSSGSPSSVSDNVSLGASGLTASTVYFYRVVGMITTGTGQSAQDVYLYGEVKRFEFTDPTQQSSNSNTNNNSNTSADPLGRVIGTAWFDIDRDNRRDANEPLLPGVDVQLTPTSVTGQSAGTVRKKNYVMKTDSSGAFDFSQLPPGTYRITSVLPGDFGIQESWDSSGNNDWQVTVTVVALQTSRGDFAAIAPAEATGTVDGGGGGTLDATWMGFDQKDDTDDDVTFTVKLSSNGGFTLQGLPTGKYSVKATSKTGRTLVSSNSLRITNKDATLTLNGLTMKVKIVAFLPATGASNMLTVFGFAAMLIPAGIATTVATRSRRRRRIS